MTGNDGSQYVLAVQACVLSQCTVKNLIDSVGVAAVSVTVSSLFPSRRPAGSLSP